MAEVEFTPEQDARTTKVLELRERLKDPAYYNDPIKLAACADALQAVLFGDEEVT